MNFKARRALSIVFGLISAIGVVATGVLVAKETPKANEKIKELKDKGVTKKFEYVKAVLPIYAPAIIVGLGSIASTTVSQVISIKTEASLIAASTMLSQGWNRYKSKIKNTLGVNADKQITNGISVDEYSKNKNALKDRDFGVSLFWEEHLGFFECRETNLLTALNDLNQRLHTVDPDSDAFHWTSLYLLMKDARANVYDKEKLEACKSIGWDLDYLVEIYGLEYMWVHPSYVKVVKKETGEILYTKLEFHESPVFLKNANKSRRILNGEQHEHDAMIDLFDAAAYELGTHGYQDHLDVEDCVERGIENELIFKESRLEDMNISFSSANTSNSTSSVYIEDYPGELPGENDIPQKGEVHG